MPEEAPTTAVVWFSSERVNCSSLSCPDLSTMDPQKEDVHDLGFAVSVANGPFDLYSATAGATPPVMGDAWFEGNSGRWYPSNFS